MNLIVTVLAILATTALGEETKSDSKADPSTLKAILNEEYYLGSGADRSKNSHNHRDKELELTEEENNIVRDVYSPDYYEPNVILDFRYMKSGGRGYARSDGGQILILPKRNQIHSLYNNYDTLIEYLRLKNLEPANKHLLFESNRQKYHEQQKGYAYHEHEDEQSHHSDAEKGWAKYKN